VRKFELVNVNVITTDKQNIFVLEDFEQSKRWYVMGEQDETIREWIKTLKEWTLVNKSGKVWNNFTSSINLNQYANENNNNNQNNQSPSSSSIIDGGSTFGMPKTPEDIEKYKIAMREKYEQAQLGKEELKKTKLERLREEQAKLDNKRREENMKMEKDDEEKKQIAVVLVDDKGRDEISQPKKVRKKLTVNVNPKSSMDEIEERIKKMLGGVVLED